MTRIVYSSDLERFQAEMEVEKEATDLLGSPLGIRVTNSAFYARYLRRYGIDVVDQSIMSARLDESVESFIGRPRPLTRENVRSSLKLGAFRSIMDMLKYTGRYAAPVRRYGPQRPVHTVGFADRTTALASSYSYSVAGETPTPMPYDGVPFVRRGRGPATRRPVNGPGRRRDR